jgi:glycosyltransferase involved in cell wall biosynthesis
MRVAFLTPSYGSTDVLGRHVQALASEVAEQGGEAEVLLHAHNHRELPPAVPGVTIRRFSTLIPNGQYAISSPLWSYLRQHAGDFDFLHAHSEATVPALLAAQPAPPHLIFTPHHYASAQTRLRRLAQGRHPHLDRRVLQVADRVLCVSQSEALQVHRRAPEAVVEIVPNGFDGTAIAAARPFPTCMHVILSVDRLTRWAGIRRVISALPALTPAYTLVVAGGGRGRSMLEAHADYLRVADRVRFLGPVSDPELYRWLRTASVLATLKEESLWGGTLLLGACAGTPVLASDIPAYREAAVLADDGGGIGFMSRRASPFAIADAIRELAGAGSRSRAGLIPTWSNVGKQTVAIYHDVLRESATPKRARAA